MTARTGCLVALGLGLFAFVALVAGVWVAELLLADVVEETVRDTIDEHDLEEVVRFRDVEISLWRRGVAFDDIRIDPPGRGHPFTADRVGCSGYWQTDGFPTHADCAVEGLEPPSDLLTGWDPTGMAATAMAGMGTPDADAGVRWALSNWSRTLVVAPRFRWHDRAALEGSLQISGIDTALAKRLIEGDTFFSAALDVATTEPDLIRDLAFDRARLTVADDGLHALWFESLALVMPHTDAEAMAIAAAGQARSALAFAGLTDTDGLAAFIEQGGSLGIELSADPPARFFDIRG